MRLPVLWAEEDGVLTDPVLLQREKVYFSVGLDGSNFISLSDPMLPLLARIVKLAAFKKQQLYNTFEFMITFLYNTILIRHIFLLYFKDKRWLFSF